MISAAEDPGSATVRADPSGRPVLTRSLLKLWRASLAALLLASGPVLGAEAPAPGEQPRALDLPVLEAVQPLAVGAEAPAFRMTALDGRSVDFEPSRHGRAHLLIFWSVFDPASGRLVPAAEELSARYGPSRLGVVGITVDGEVMKRTIERAVRTMRVSYPICIDGRGADETLPLAFAYGVRATPTAYVIDRKGRVAWAGEGYRDEGALEEAVRKVIAEKPGP